MNGTRERPGHNPCLTSWRSRKIGAVGGSLDRQAKKMDAFPKTSTHITENIK